MLHGGGDAVRKPTPRDALYRWHADALAGLNPPVDDTAHCGWFKRKLVKGGVFVPARIWMAQEIDADTGELLCDETLQCEVNGSPADPEEAWSWLCANPITEQEFLYLEAAGEWSRRHAPVEPMANPHQRVDWMAVPTPTF